MSKTCVLSCRDLRLNYGDGDGKIAVLKGIDLSVYSGSRIAIMGSSGAGKSSLLNLLGGLDTPAAGKVYLGDSCLTDLSVDQRASLRNKHLGFVYQFHHLMPEFNALENTAMPCLIAGMSRAEAFAKAESLLTSVGLAARKLHRPSQLSGGERQRVAIARALVMAPKCVLLDEPTGNLDSDTAKTVLSLLDSLSQALQTAFVVVTHDLQLAQTMDKIYRLDHGNLVLQA